MMRTNLTFALGLMISCGSAFGGLDWQSLSGAAAPDFAEARATVEFPFTVSGSNAVRIVSATPLCDCMTAKVERVPETKSGDAMLFAPGERGKIVAVFDIGARQGLQEKKIQVITGDKAAPKTELVLKVKIPEVMQIRPTFVHWKDGEGFEPRVVTVCVAPDFPLKTLQVMSSNALIRAELKGENVQNNIARGAAPGDHLQTLQPREYQLAIVPKTDDVPADALANLHAEVNVQLEDVAGRKKIYPIHVRIRGEQELIAEPQ